MEVVRREVLYGKGIHILGRVFEAFLFLLGIELKLVHHSGLGAAFLCIYHSKENVYKIYDFLYGESSSTFLNHRASRILSLGT